MAWADIDVTSSGSDFLKLTDGDNKIRIVSKNVKQYVFWEDGKKRITTNPNEMVDGKKPKQSWTMYAIDRADGAIKLFTMGPSIAHALNELAASPDYKFTDYPNYDLNIKRTGSGMETRYTVLPGRDVTKLTDEEETILGALPSIEDAVAAIS